MDILRTLADEHEIKQIYHRYCDVIDAKAFEDLDQVFTADCVGDYRDSNGIVQKGLQPLVTHLYANMGPNSTCGATHHNVLNFQIRPVGDRATGQVHFYAVHRGVGAMAGDLYTVWGRYDDQLVRTGQGWRINRRRYQNDVTDGDKAVIRNGRPQPGAAS
jgi:3-phenylpropionate/cinnamic acid dioxygenase small subunit